MTIEKLYKDNLLIRFEHIYQNKEDKILSQPVTIEMQVSGRCFKDISAF